MVLSILLQEDKSGGGIGFLGGSSQSFFGVSSGSILSKFTSILLVIFLISAIGIAILSARSSKTITETDITKTEFSDYKAKTTIVDPNKDFLDEDLTEDKLTE
jgi:protein translocase SecG subunit